MVWVGDTVEAVITSIDRHTRRLRLSIRARLRQLEEVSKMMAHLNSSFYIERGLVNLLREIYSLNWKLLPQLSKRWPHSGS